MYPFAARFYDSNPMCAQKIQALSSPKRHAVRDLFDLDHLFSSTLSKPEMIKKSIQLEDVENAAEKIEGFQFKDFREQVLPYLSESLVTLYSDPAAFNDLKKRVENHLLEMMD